MKKKQEFVQQVSEKWQRTGLTAVICPTYPNCAFKKDHTFDLGGQIDYAIIWTVLDYPCGIIPVTQVQNDEQTFRDHYNDKWTSMMNKTAQNSENLPVCL